MRTLSTVEDFSTDQAQGERLYGENYRRLQMFNNGFLLTLSAVRTYQEKYGVGQLVELFGGRSNNHLLNYEKMSVYLCYSLHRMGVTELTPSDVVPCASDHSDMYITEWWKEDSVDPNVVEALTRHLDDRHDLYQNLPYYMADLGRRYRFDHNLVTDNAILYGLGLIELNDS